MNSYLSLVTDWEIEMTGRRATVTWKLEKTPSVEDTSAQFEYFAPSMDFNYTMNNNVRYAYTLGSKFYDVVTAGRFSGTWSANVTLDYNHFKWLLLVFEGYEYDSDVADNPNGVHKFTKSNLGKLRTATFCVKKLNRIVGGTADQTVKLLGCVVTSFKATYESSSTSTVRCSLSGVYMKEEMSLADLQDTDFVEKPSPSVIPVEWGCLKIDDGGGNVKSVATNERCSMSLNQQVSTLPSCGTRFDSDFYEGQVSKISTEMSIYSRDPQMAYLRVYSGGKVQDINKENTYTPYSKSIKPVPEVRISSSYKDDSSVTAKNYGCEMIMDSAIFESMGMSLSAGSQIVDRPTISCRNARIEISSADVKSALI